jgi:hypothetical protein
MRGIAAMLPEQPFKIPVVPVEDVTPEASIAYTTN